MCICTLYISYTCIAKDDIKLLDISNFLAAGFSYSQFLLAFNVSEEKLYYPYEWVDNISKLDSPSLPPYHCFFSKLKNVNVLDEEYAKWNGEGIQPKTGEEKYEELLALWKNEGMKTFKDFLICYNNQDVGPFVKAIENMLEFYKEKELDIFKIAVSLPGISRRMLFDAAKKEGATFTLFSESYKHVYYTVNIL